MGGAQWLAVARQRRVTPVAFKDRYGSRHPDAALRVVRPAQAHEWRRYRALRLAALRDAPDAFGSTYAEEAARPEAVWRERFLSAVSSDQHCLLFAAPEGRPCGVVWCKQTTQACADLYQMWVAPEARGQGYGRQLLHAAADWARAQGVRQMRLSVSGGNHAARALYHAFGFRPSGERAPLRPGSARWVDDLLLTLAP